MLWRLFQIAVGGAVLYSEGLYHWSTGPMVAPVCAVAAAWLATAAVCAVIDLVGKQRAWFARKARLMLRRNQAQQPQRA